MKLAIFGAKSIALGVCLAIQRLYPEHEVETFLVSSLKDNPSILAGLPVQEVQNYSNKEMLILIAVPEDLHQEITKCLEKQGFFHYVGIDSRKESILMEHYFGLSGAFHSIRRLPFGDEKADLRVYQAKFYKDRQLKEEYEKPDWIVPIQAGAVLTAERVADETDCVGEQISEKNVNYCELTALYWMWKNKLLWNDSQNNGVSNTVKHIEYYGLFHYRRVLDIQEEDLLRIKENHVDVILPYPTVHEPDIYEHHTRYVRSSDWGAMMAALWELQPVYAEAFERILKQPYLYNYNIVIARRQILADYCAWLFPILNRVEELSVPKGSERADRYIGYLGENLLTLYFLYHQNSMKIVHTGRIMLK